MLCRLKVLSSFSTPSHNRREAHSSSIVSSVSYASSLCLLSWFQGACESSVALPEGSGWASFNVMLCLFVGWLVGWSGFSV